jgi:hypothetical protein
MLRRVALKTIDVSEESRNHKVFKMDNHTSESANQEYN